MKSLKFLEHVAPDASIYFQVSGIGILEPMPACIINRPHGTGHWLLMHFHNPVKLIDASGFSVVPAGSFVLWEPNTPQLFGNSDKGWSHSWMQFQGSAVQNLVSLLGFPLSVPILVPEDSVERILFEIYQERVCQTSPDQVILERLFNVLLRRAARVLSQENSCRNVNADRMTRAKIYMDMHYQEKISLKTLASTANLSIQHFSEEFKRNFKISHIDYLTGVRIRQSEIAYKVGYNDLCHFSKMYKKRVGVSPVQTRDAGALRPSITRVPPIGKTKQSKDADVDCLGVISGSNA